jgi:hypothetical protein
MHKKILAIAMAALLAGHASGKEPVAEFSGASTTGTMTHEFKVEAPWIVDWRVYSLLQDSMAVEIALLEGPLNLFKGKIAKTKRPDNGVRLFHESGTFRFRISAGFARWHLKVEELTPAEAALYTPREDEDR